MSEDLSDAGLRKKVGDALTFVFLRSTGIFVLRLFFVPILVRIISQSEYGNYVFILSIIDLSITISIFGTNDAIRKYAAEISQSSSQVLRRFVFSSLLLTVFLSIVASLVGLSILHRGLIKVNLESNVLSYLHFAVGVVAISILFNNAMSVLFGLHMQRISEPLRFIQTMICFGIGLLLAYSGFGVKGLLSAHILSLIFALVAGVYVITKKVHFSVQAMKEGLYKYSRRLLSFGRWIVVGALFAQVLYQADVIMIRSFLSAKDAALYKAALIPAHFLWFIPRIVSVSLLPSLSELWSKGDVSKVASVSFKSVRYVFWLSLLMGCGLFILSKPFVKVYYGEDYLPAALALQILIVGTFGFAISRITGPVFQASENLSIEVLCTGLAAVLNVMLNLFLIPPYGIYGAAVATSVSYGFMLLSKTWGLKRRTNIGLFKGFPYKNFAMLATILLGILYLINWIPILSPASKIVLGAGVGLITHLFVSKKLGLIDDSDFKIFYHSRLFPRVIKVVYRNTLGLFKVGRL